MASNEDMTARILQGSMFQNRFEELCKEFDSIKKLIDEYGSNLLWIHGGADFEVILMRMAKLNRANKNYRAAKEHWLKKAYSDEPDFDDFDLYDNFDEGL